MLRRTMSTLKHHPTPTLVAAVTLPEARLEACLAILDELGVRLNCPMLCLDSRSRRKDGSVQVCFFRPTMPGKHVKLETRHGLMVNINANTFRTADHPHVAAALARAESHHFEASTAQKVASVMLYEYAHVHDFALFEQLFARLGATETRLDSALFKAETIMCVHAYKTGAPQ